MKKMKEELEITVRLLGGYSNDENREIEEVDRLAFEGQDDELDWSTPEWLIAGKYSNRIVSIITILKRLIKVGEVYLDVGGVGGVATHPDYQRQGFGSALLRYAADFMRDDLKVDFGLLVCDREKVPFYARLGWQTAEAEMVFDFRGIKRVFTEITMILPLEEKPWPQGTIDLCGKPW